MGSKIGRPKKDLCAETIYDLAAIGVTAEEMAHMFRVDKGTIYNNYRDDLYAGRSIMKESLRRQQYKMAMEGNVTMLIWLGKQLLGQKENPVDTSDPVGKVRLKKADA